MWVKNLNMSTKALNKTLSVKKQNKKCSICADHEQKIEEIEQILSGREDIIKALQCRLKKSETNYQKLLEDFEQLRFEHSFALQDNFSLKEINSKLEEISQRHANSSVNKNSEKIIGSQENKNYSSSNQAAFSAELQEVGIVEELLKKQKQTLQGLIDKVIKELQAIRGEHSGCAVEFLYHIQNNNHQTEGGDFKGIEPKFEELNEEIRKLKHEIDFQQGENKRFRYILGDKKRRLTKNTSFGASIAPITPNLFEEPNSKTMSYSSCCEKAVQLIKKELEKKDRIFEESTGQLMQQLTDLNNNNQILSDTLSIVTAENKSNVEIIKKLKTELNRVNIDFERKACHLSCKAARLEQILDETNVSKRRLSDSVETGDAEVKNLKERLKQLIQENKNLNNRITELETGLNKPHPYGGDLAALRRELDEKNAELVEYEEENRYYCQRMEVLVNHNADLTRHIRQLEIELMEKLKEVEKADIATQSEEFKDLTPLQSEVEQLDKENQYLLSQLQQMKSLKGCNMTQVGQIEQLAEENASLMKQITRSEKELGKKQETIDRLSRDLESVTNSGDKSKKTFTTPINYPSSGQETIDKLNKENRCLKEQCQYAEKLKESFKKQLEEMILLEKENNKLKQMVEKVRRDSASESARLQELVDHSHNQVEMLLKEHDKKSTEIEAVANELETIRHNVSKDTDNFSERVKDLENERDQLLLRLKDHAHENGKNCTCEIHKEIERLKTELIKKQIIIAELEANLDTFNDTLKSFDMTAENLASENSSLKVERMRIEEDRQKIQEVKRELDNVKAELELIRRERDELVQKNFKLEEKQKSFLLELNQNQKMLRDVEEDRNSLRQEVLHLRGEKREMEKSLANNYHLQIELEGLKKEVTRKDQTFFRKLDEMQKVYDELKKAFDGLNEDNEILRRERNKLNEELKALGQELNESRNSKTEQQNACSCLETQNEMLKNQTNMAIKELDALRSNCEQLKTDATLKYVEVECLKSDVQVLKKDKIICEQNCKKKLTDMNTQLEDLQKNYEERSGEVKKLKKQYESAVNSSKLTREEYKNLKKEYKDIKTMLSDQIKRYRYETGQLEGDKPPASVNDLQKQLFEKEKEILLFQQKLKDSSYEIIELKDYIHKLICDNNILKSAINNLIGNLEKKIKGSVGNVEVIASEILTSLTNIEDIITKNGESGNCPCPKGCKGKSCNCMSEICSQYSLRDPSQVPSTDLCPGIKSNKTDYSQASLRTNTETEITTISQPSSKRRTNESKSRSNNAHCDYNTTDSDDMPTTNNVLDKQSIDFFKDQIEDLKTRIDRTMKEKCCDCEQYFITTNSNNNN